VIAKWKRTYLHFSSLEERDDVLQKLANIKKLNKNYAQTIKVGFNSVMRLLEAREASVVVVAHDGLHTMLRFIVEAALAQNVPVLSMPKLNHALRLAVGLKSASIFAVRKLVDVSGNATVLEGPRGKSCSENSYQENSDSSSDDEDSDKEEDTEKGDENKREKNCEEDSCSEGQGEEQEERKLVEKQLQQQHVAVLVDNLRDELLQLREHILASSAAGVV
jgi:ribosomal protein L7Ae-like RNA K-turn-binding protein